MGEYPFMKCLLSVALLATSVVGSALPAQESRQRTRVTPVSSMSTEGTPKTPRATGRFSSRADSLEYVRARTLAAEARGYRVVISLEDRTLWVLYDSDTIRTATVAVASGLTLDFAGRKWTFRTPREARSGRHKVDPTWTPPDWMYAEAALEHQLRLAPLSRGNPVQLKDGRQLAVRDSVVGIIDLDEEFYPLPTDEHIVFESTLFIPPYGTINRKVAGELGAYALDLGDGYLLHGTPYVESLGNAATHGCIRLGDDDIEWLYLHVGRGTPVYIY
jgi:lipoprotein-anchoring transpeptidase ErfK/SrfK